MNVQPIEEIPRQVAREKFLAYRRSVREKHSAEDEAMMRCYRELARGRVLVDLAHVIPEAGLNANREPRLAIARSDQTQAWYHCRDGTDRGDGTPAFSSVRGHWGSVEFQSRSDGRCIRLPKNSMPPLPKENAYTQRALRANVPPVPSELRPKVHLRNYHTLFEVPRWDVELEPADPLLLKRVSGLIFAVVAKWDVTALEAAVLRGLRS